MGTCNTKHRHLGPNDTCPTCGVRGALGFRVDLDLGQEFDPRALQHLSDYHRKFPNDLSNVFIVIIGSEEFCGRDAFFHWFMKQFPLEVSEVIELRKFHYMEWHCPVCKSHKCAEYPGSYNVEAIKREILQARNLNNDIRADTQAKFPWSTSGMPELTMGFLFLHGRYARYLPELGFHIAFIPTANYDQRLDECRKYCYAFHGSRARGAQGEDEFPDPQETWNRCLEGQRKRWSSSSSTKSMRPKRTPRMTSGTLSPFHRASGTSKRRL